ncbi:TlyA family rRNA (cytidine-2'-O)-methyltransferase [Candidatus Marinamargulisbacteria bacterium SCGC AAA071-K20]|nr:TlyA family rRNA (cytidine-2'-O)-methyltransferase [Candidatus Marinamargulisbacteria bacterium SCGC AAA071-K20]
MAKPKKQRIDQLLLDKGYADDLKTAQAIILTGKVTINGQKIDKIGSLIRPDLPISIKKSKTDYVSRGGDKLKGAIERLNLNFGEKVCLDVGISTGGFTDCALKYNARAVIGVDVGYGQVAMSLQQDKRVCIIERTNAKTLTIDLMKTALLKQKMDPELAPKISMVIMDVSFISVIKLLPTVRTCVVEGTHYIILIKPQFEAKKDEIGEGGIIRDVDVREKILDRVQVNLEKEGFTLKSKCESPIKGAQGNTEYFFYLTS